MYVPKCWMSSLSMSIVRMADAPNHFSNVIDRSKTEVVFIERRCHRAAVVISPERYEQLLETLEEAEDVAAFDEALAKESPTSPQDRDRIQGAIALLGEDPQPPGAKALQECPGLRVRIGNQRIIYTVDDNILVVAVIALGRRSNVYER